QAGLPLRPARRRARFPVSLPEARREGARPRGEVHARVRPRALRSRRRRGRNRGRRLSPGGARSMTETEKIKIAVIGAGKMGTHHARALSKVPGVELVGVCDTNVWKAQLAA